MGTGAGAGAGSGDTAMPASLAGAGSGSKGAVGPGVDESATVTPRWAFTTTVRPKLSWKTECKDGRGLAVSTKLGLIVTSNESNALDVFSLTTRDGVIVGIMWLKKVGRAGSVGYVVALGTQCLANLHGVGLTLSPSPTYLVYFACRDGFLRFCFKFMLNKCSGYLCFTHSAKPLLLVSDTYNDVVHVIDVEAGTHVRHLCPPGTMRPRGVAASPALIAVSAWLDGRTAHDLHLFDASTYEYVRVICSKTGPQDGRLEKPYGLRISSDGLHVVVADHNNERVSMFRVKDGAFVRHLATDLKEPRDVEECADGWLVACEGTKSVPQCKREGVSFLRFRSGGSVEVHIHFLLM